MIPQRHIPSSTTWQKYLLTEEFPLDTENLDLSLSPYITENPGFFKLSLLPCLQVLDLSGCSLRTIDVVCDLVHLLSLNLSDNQIRLLPSCERLSLLEALVSLDLRNNCRLEVAEVEKLRVSCKSLKELKIDGQDRDVRRRLEKLNKEQWKTELAIKKLESQLMEIAQHKQEKCLNRLQTSENEIMEIQANLKKLQTREEKIQQKITLAHSYLKDERQNLVFEYDKKLHEFCISEKKSGNILDLIIHQHELILRLASNSGQVVEDRDELIQLLTDFARQRGE